MAGNQELIQDMNYHKILETIICDGLISRAELSKRLGLTKATISNQVQKLLDDGLVEETGSQETSKGRRPIMLKFRGDHARVLALDIGRGHINLLTADLLGQHCRFLQHPWTMERDRLLPLLIQIIEETLADSAAEPIIGICAGIHVIVHENEILFTPY